VIKERKKQGPKKNRHMMSIPNHIYALLLQVTEIKAKQFGISRRLPPSYVVEYLCKKEMRAIAAKGLSTGVLTAAGSAKNAGESA